MAEPAACYNLSMTLLKFRSVWTFIGYCLIGLVVVLSLTPSAPPPDYIPLEDKFKHMLAYGTLMLWFAQLYPKTRYPILAVSFIGLGVLMELLQSQTGTRTADGWDILANGVGALMSWGLALIGVNNLFHQFENRFLKSEK